MALGHRAVVREAQLGGRRGGLVAGLRIGPGRLVDRARGLAAAKVAAAKVAEGSVAGIRGGVLAQAVSGQVLGLGAVGGLRVVGRGVGQGAGSIVEPVVGLGAALAAGLGVILMDRDGVSGRAVSGQGLTVAMSVMLRGDRAEAGLIVVASGQHADLTVAIAVVTGDRAADWLGDLGVVRRGVLGGSVMRGQAVVRGQGHMKIGQLRARGGCVERIWLRSWSQARLRWRLRRRAGRRGGLLRRHLRNR